MRKLTTKEEREKIFLFILTEAQPDFMESGRVKNGSLEEAFVLAAEKFDRAPTAIKRLSSRYKGHFDRIKSTFFQAWKERGDIIEMDPLSRAGRVVDFDVLGKGFFLLNNSICGAIDVVRAANEILEQRGEESIPYPML